MTDSHLGHHFVFISVIFSFGGGVSASAVVQNHPVSDFIMGGDIIAGLAVIVQLDSLQDIFPCLELLYIDLSLQNFQAIQRDSSQP